MTTEPDVSPITVPADPPPHPITVPAEPEPARISAATPGFVLDLRFVSNSAYAALLLEMV